VKKVEGYCHDIGTNVAYYAHASAGCLHIRPLINTKTASEIAKMADISSFALDLLHGYGGSLSSEHGDGRARSWLNEQFFGPDLYDLYTKVKQIFDPSNLLNPGTIVNGGPMTENLRFGESYKAIQIDSRVNFEDDFGFDGAVEMCNGNVQWGRGLQEKDHRYDVPELYGDARRRTQHPWQGKRLASGFVRRTTGDRTHKREDVRCHGSLRGVQSL